MPGRGSTEDSWCNAWCSLEGHADGVAPASANSASAACNSFREPSTSSISHSRQLLARTAPSSGVAFAVTRSSLTSANTFPASPINRCTTRRVVSVATGRSSRSRTQPPRWASSSGGTPWSSSRNGSASSARSSPPCGSFRCQPASDPPVRRRSVIPAVASASSGVSQYTASSVDCRTGSTATTFGNRIRSGSSAPAVTS